MLLFSDKWQDADNKIVKNKYVIDTTNMKKTIQMYVKRAADGILYCIYSMCYKVIIQIV